MDERSPIADTADFDDYEEVLVTVEIRPGDRLSKDLKRRTSR